MIWSDCFFKECLFGGIAGLKLWRLLVSGSRKQRGLLRLGTRWQLGLKGWNTLSLYFENTTKTVLIVHLTKLRPNLTLQLCSFSNDFGFYNWAFGVPGNFSTSSNEETGERLHSGKTQVQNISQSLPPSTSWNLGVSRIFTLWQQGRARWQSC